MKNHYTVVGETLTVFRMPEIRKTGQCLDGQVGKTFPEIFGRNFWQNFRQNFEQNFLKFREAMNASLFRCNYMIV